MSEKDTTYVVPPKRVSYLDEIRKLTAELVVNVVPLDSKLECTESSVTDSGRRVVTDNNISYLVVLDKGFFKVSEFWAQNKARVSFVEVTERTWFFILKGSSELIINNKVVEVNSGDNVYLDIGDTLGEFQFTGNVQGVRVTMAPV